MCTCAILIGQYIMRLYKMYNYEQYICTEQTCLLIRLHKFHNDYKMIKQLVCKHLL